jgi:hypothetical protein
MMNLEVLSSSESMTLCRAAANQALSRFRRLAHQAEQGGCRLSQLFMELAGDVERNLVEMNELDGRDPLPEAHVEETAQKVARGFLPSLSKSRDRLDRESGFYVVECILGELAGFYGTLVRQSRDEKSRDLLLRSKQAITVRLEYLRHVVL